MTAIHICINMTYPYVHGVRSDSLSYNHEYMYFGCILNPRPWIQDATKVLMLLTPMSLMGH